MDVNVATVDGRSFRWTETQLLQMAVVIQMDGNVANADGRSCYVRMRVAAADGRKRNFGWTYLPSADGRKRSSWCR